MDFQQRIESEKHRISLEAQQLEQEKQRFAAREKSLMDRELQFQTRSGEYLADAKRTIDMHGAANNQRASVLSLQQSQLKEKEVALQTKIDADQLISRLSPPVMGGFRARQRACRRGILARAVLGTDAIHSNWLLWTRPLST